MIINIAFVNDLTEEGFQGPNHVGGATQNYKQLIIIHVQLAGLDTVLYRVSQEEWTKLRESVPYVELYRYNPKHLYPKLNGYGDNGQRSLKP